MITRLPTQQLNPKSHPYLHRILGIEYLSDTGIRNFYNGAPEAPKLTREELIVLHWRYNKITGKEATRMLGYSVATLQRKLQVLRESCQLLADAP